MSGRASVPVGLRFLLRRSDAWAVWIRRSRSGWLRLAAAVLLLVSRSQAQVVINEIFYHAPAELAELQWIELHNPTDHPVDLSGWTLNKGVKFTFPAGTAIAAEGYSVVCANRELFGQHYSVPVAGEFEKRLKHSGEQIVLRNRAGEVVDRVTFGNRPPWPESPNGGTASLERICPIASGASPENWAASALAAEARQPGGTPGQRNSTFSATLPPVIRDVTFAPESATPGQAISVQATIRSDTALREVAVLCQTVSPGQVSEEVPVTMTKGPTEASYVATLPTHEAGQIVRFRIRATDQRAARRFYPGENEPRPALSCLVTTNVAVGKVPVGFLIHTDAGQAERAQRRRPNRGPGGPPDEAMMARFMIEMQLGAQLDLAGLWAGLTLSNGTPAGIEKLMPIFRGAEVERTQLERKTLDRPDPQRAAEELPQTLTTFKAGLGEKLTPLLDAEQAQRFAAWRDRPPPEPGPFGFGGDPAMMVRQFIRLEPAYLHLCTLTNLTATQLVTIRGVYREAIRQRDAVAAQAGRFMGPPTGENDDREEVMAKLQAIEPDVEHRLQGVLTPPQLRAFATWRQENQPSFMGPGDGGRSPEPARGNDAFVYWNPATGRPRLFDFVHIPERSGGWKVQFGRDDSLNGMTGINLIFEASERWVLAEPLAYEFYRRAGQASPLTDFVRLSVDGQPLGYHLLIEQPNKAFLRRNGLRDDGNLYKANWRGQGLIGQHEKRTSATAGHDDLVQLVEQVEQAKADPAAQWALIKREFDASEVINHYAVRLITCDWDGFFNNYFLYHDLKGTKKWTLYPWDQDQVWGDGGGFGDRGDLFYTMALTYGAEGDRPPGARGERPRGPMMMDVMGGAQWRAGGYLSKPLLVNPTLRRLFLARIKELLDTEFTEARLAPWIEELRGRLNDEVRRRAELSKEDPARALERFDQNLSSLKTFVARRRQWLLEQTEIKTAGPYDRAQLE